MEKQTFKVSRQTTESAQTAEMYIVPVPTGKTAIIEVEFLAKSAGNKRITGKSRVCYTNIAGTPTVLDAAIDPYLKKDASGFPNDALFYSVDSTDVIVEIKGFSGQGNTLWDLLITVALS